MKAITLVLPYPLSANKYWRPVRVGPRMSIAPTAQAKEYRRKVAFLAHEAGIREPIDGRINLTVELYPQRPQDWKSRQKKRPLDWDDSVLCIDLGNCEKVISDALNCIAWHDDKQHRRIVLQRMAPDDKGARAVVTIECMHTEATRELTSDLAKRKETTEELPL